MPLNPAIAHWLAGQIAEKNKDNVSAEREYRAFIAASHSSARSWVELAIFYRHIGRLTEMEEALRHVEAAPVDQAESLIDAASVLLKAGRDLPLAVRILRRYLTAPVERGPAFKAHEMLGQLLEKQGDRAGAAEEYRAALALARSYKGAQEGLKRVSR